jgi:hypothetical protein
MKGVDFLMGATENCLLPSHPLSPLPPRLLKARVMKGEDFLMGAIETWTVDTVDDITETGECL